MRGRSLAALMILLLCLAGSVPGGAEEPEKLTDRCSFRLESGKFSDKKIRDDDYRTYMSLGAGRALLIESPGQPMGSLTLRCYDRSALMEIWAEQAGEWVPAGSAGRHLSDWVALPEGTQRVQIRNVDRARLFLAEVDVYAPGDRPADSPVWEDPEQVDLLAAVCHPDDELLWLGGLLPTVAGEEKRTVLVVCAVPSTPLRRLEMLDALWHCGVTAYPVFLGRPDVYTRTLADAYKRWGKKSMAEQYTGLIRRYRPLVVVTHDFRGEYGHGGHRAVADAVARSVVGAGDPAVFPASAGTYGTWQPQKLYVHLWEERQIRLDWHRPLAAFGGKDGMTVAREAMAMHASQLKRGWAIEEGGPCDNSLFGLYFTRVGEDEAGDDLFEHTDKAERE